MRPDSTEYDPHFAGYVSLAPEDDVVSAIEHQSGETQRLLASIDEQRGAYRYAEGKWSVKQVIGHLADAEHVFGYRALAISRGETQPLPGFDEAVYVGAAGFDSWKMGDLAEAYALARRSNIVMFRNLPAEAWERMGVANGAPVSVRALAHIIVGHERHHLKVLRERYLVR